jgi:hypothetical protein
MATPTDFLQHDVSSPSASMSRDFELHPKQDLTEYLREYAREKPEVVALWCFGVGFILGWKLKPW